MLAQQYTEVFERLLLYLHGLKTRAKLYASWEKYDLYRNTCTITLLQGAYNSNRYAVIYIYIYIYQNFLSIHTTAYTHIRTYNKRILVQVSHRTHTCTCIRRIRIQISQRTYISDLYLYLSRTYNYSDFPKDIYI